MKGRKFSQSERGILCREVCARFKVSSATIIKAAHNEIQNATSKKKNKKTNKQTREKKNSTLASKIK
jgi:transposase